MTRHYPVEGRYLNDVPAVEHDCDDEFHVASGAFTTTKPKAAKADVVVEPTPAKAESKE